MPRKLMHKQRRNLKGGERSSHAFAIGRAAGTAKGVTTDVLVASMSAYNPADLNGLMKAVHVSNIRIDAQAIAPSTFATNGSAVVPYSTCTPYGWALVKRPYNTDLAVMDWESGPENPFCDQPDNLIAWGIIPTNQEVTQIRVPYGRTLHMGDSMYLLITNIMEIPANVSGLPDQGQEMHIAMSYNFQ